jgi:hypothetical protein
MNATGDSITVWLCITHVSLPQLPVYVPDDEEKKDPEKYAMNVRKYMVGFCPPCGQSILKCMN